MNELLLTNLLRALSLRRAKNIILTYASFFVSLITGKVYVWGRPPVMTIEPTNICNLKCPLCTTGAGEMERSNGKMSLETFGHLLAKFGDDILFLLIYHQGEPYINPHFFEFVSRAKQNNIYVTTSTNGHYFTDAAIQKTIDSGLDSMIVSVDGLTQESYERYRVGGKLEKVLDGTRRLMAAKKRAGSKTPNVALQFLVMKHNEHELPRLKQLAEDLGVDKLLIKNIEVRSLEEAHTWLPENTAMQRYNLTEDDFIAKGADKKSCTRPWMSTLVNWDGTFVPCCFDKNGEHPMGDVRQINDSDDLWHSASYSSFRRQLLSDRKQIDICRNCNQGFGSFLPEKLIRNSTRTKNAQAALQKD